MPVNDAAAAWMVDLAMPILKGEDRKYIEDLIYVGE